MAGNPRRVHLRKRVKSVSMESQDMKRVHPCWDVFIPGRNEISELETPVTERHLSESPYFYFVLSPAVTVALSLAHTRLSCSTVNVSVIVSHSLSDALPPSSVCLFPLRSPFLDKRMSKDGGAVARKAKHWFHDCCATVVVQESRQRRPGRYPSFL